MHFKGFYSLQEKKRVFGTSFYQLPEINSTPWRQRKNKLKTLDHEDITLKISHLYAGRLYKLQQQTLNSMPGYRE